MKRWKIVAVVSVVALASAGAMVWAHSEKASPRVVRVAEVRAPEGQRIRVQVLNGTKVRGLARRATTLLRDRGFDVVEMGTISDTRDTTLVLDLSGHPDWANRVARVLAPARVEARRDTSRYLDIAIILGSTWRAPPDPFNP